MWRLVTDLVDLLEPAVDAVEGPLVGDVVDQQDALRAARVGADDGAEAALPRRVPQLQPHALAVQQDRRRLVRCTHNTSL